ncbi:MAG: methionyl-tRNA formyltransferase-like protein [Rhizomicrobium sp.]
MRQFEDILRGATSNITEEYFQLPVEGGPAIYRERVYTYELYHQMRCLWPKEGTELRLNGEVDKKAHPVLSQREMRLAIPDLLVHGPGYMARNYAVIEIKPQTASPIGIEKDVGTLSEFVRVAGYERAVYLHYGYDLADELLTAIEGEARKIGAPKIEVWLHHRPMEAAELVHVVDVGG